MRSHASCRACFVAALALLIPIADASAQPAPPSPVTFLVQGKGWGHGRGLGQWGALGYALKGWTSAQILDRFYGGTTPGAVDAASEVRVRLLREDDVDVIVMSERNLLSTGAIPGVFTALRAQPQPDGTYSLQSGPGCAGPWTAIATAPSVDFRTDPAALTSADPSALLAMCEPGGTMRYYRGSLLAVRGRERCVARGERRATRPVRPGRRAPRGLGVVGRPGQRRRLPSGQGAGDRGPFVRVVRVAVLVREDV